MSGSVVLIHLAGAIALLLWATRMVRTGVERAYGDVLRRKLRNTLSNPIIATLAGALLAICFQSATAVSILVGSFVGSGIVGGSSGLIAVLGADLGSALVVRLLSFDLSLLVPIATFAGTTIFLVTENRIWKQFGRILVGVGLLLLSLQLIGLASEPLRESHILPVIINYLSSDVVTAFLIAAIATWLFHSSVAFILLVAALASRELMPVELGVVMILGANLGGGLIAALLSRTMPAPSRSVPLSNLVMRGIFAVIVLAGISLFRLPVEMLGSTPALQVVHAHIAFNLGLIIVGLPLAPLVHRQIAKWLSGNNPQVGELLAEREASALDPAALDVPSRALANVTRAVVGMCETLEVMLKNVMELYDQPDRPGIDALAELDDKVDRKHASIKLYLAKIPPEQMSETETRRTHELLEACVALEQVGDIITRNMVVHIHKKLERGLTFTPEGWQELSSLHASVLSSARLAFNVLISRDADIALQLVQEKDRLREIERHTRHRHFDRLRDNTKKSIETSSLHLDTIRDLKQINSLLASLAYPVLKERGMLGGTRLTLEPEAV
ncbi:Na/Pi cotransporter family protein [Shinella granuli]|uniref:Phosphate:Na+ symporter n=1 Tax=Shinella granuli TaxID=323621 RepID=A0A4R2BZV0_SHIGR|nr:Na/Pi cotransporter family protein [Shinella granuli]TCN33528.1 phosphate:Na+ symporter [Shinella granuli]